MVPHILIIIICTLLMQSFQLSFFPQVCGHILRITRVLQQLRGNMILVSTYKSALHIEADNKMWEVLSRVLCDCCNNVCMFCDEIHSVIATFPDFL